MSNYFSDVLKEQKEIKLFQNRNFNLKINTEYKFINKCHYINGYDKTEISKLFL